MKIKPQTAILIALAIFVCGIAVTSAAGVWTTKGSKTPAKLKDAQHSETYDPSDIRGSYAFSDISRLYNIPPSDLSEAFGVDLSQAQTFKCKDLETLYQDAQFEIGTGSVRMFAAYYLGLSYNQSEETYLPETAAKILSEKGRMTEEQRRYLEGHTIAG